MSIFNKGMTPWAQFQGLHYRMAVQRRGVYTKQGF